MTRGPRCPTEEVHFTGRPTDLQALDRREVLDETGLIFGQGRHPADAGEQWGHCRASPATPEGLPTDSGHRSPAPAEAQSHARCACRSGSAPPRDDRAEADPDDAGCRPQASQSRRRSTRVRAPTVRGRQRAGAAGRRDARRAAPQSSARPPLTAPRTRRRKRPRDRSTDDRRTPDTRDRAEAQCRGRASAGRRRCSRRPTSGWPTPVKSLMASVA